MKVLSFLKGCLLMMVGLGFLGLVIIAGLLMLLL